MKTEPIPYATFSESIDERGIFVMQVPTKGKRFTKQEIGILTKLMPQTKFIIIEWGFGATKNENDDEKF